MSHSKPAGDTALIVIDMLNRLDFPGGEALRPKAEAAGEAILRLRDGADEAGLPVIYVNDNHDDRLEDRAAIVAKACDQQSPGQTLSQRLAPQPHHYFVVKPQFSGFCATTLPAILPGLGVSRLVLTGIAADICILFTAADAHMREYRLWVPADTVTSEEDARTGWALDTMRSSMGADTRPTTERRLADWVADS